MEVSDKFICIYSQVTLSQV